MDTRLGKVSWEEGPPYRQPLCPGGEWPGRQTPLARGRGCKVGSSLFLGEAGLSHGLRRAKLVQDVTDVQAGNTPTGGHLSSRKVMCGTPTASVALLTWQCLWMPMEVGREV